MTVYEAALHYRTLGFSVVPCLLDGTKKPMIKWGEYQERKPTDTEMRHWFESRRIGIALVQGAVSGNTEVLDFDSPGAYTEFRELCASHGYLALLESCGEVKTPSGGRHVYYRCPVIEGNQKLARDADKTTKIETRGEGGYTIAPHSPPSVHPTNIPYEWVRESIPTITPEERSALLAFCRACNVLVDVADTHRTKATSTTLGDDYNRRGDILSVLLSHGWQEAGRRGDTIDLVRPGKSVREGVSATLGYVGENVLYVFSANADPFDMNRAYSAFSVYGLLEHGGDFKAAAQELAKRGYGEQGSSWSVPVSLGDDDDADTLIEFPRTDLGNAERLVHRCGGDLRWSGALGWLSWDGKRWQGSESGEEVRRMMETVRAIRLEEAPAVRKSGVPNEEAAYKRATELEKHSFASESASRIKSALELAKAIHPIPIDTDALDSDPMLLNCQNGTLDLRTLVLKPHERTDFITKILPIDYDPNAQCPTWIKAVNTWQPEPEMQGYVQRIFGYALTGDVSEQCLFFLYGGGSNGKSTYLKIGLTLMAGYGKQASSELLVAKKGEMIRDDVASLAGKRFVATIEVDDGRAMAEGLVKQLSGGDRITARFLYKNSFEFEPTFKVFLAANHKPVVRGSDHGIWRRIRMVPFTQTISEADKDPYLYDKLMAELSGILAWAVRGCQDWRLNGMQTPESVLAFTREYREESDQIGMFLNEECVREPEALIRPATLYDAYCRWCEARRERSKSMTAFGRTIAEKGIEKIVRNGYPHYVGMVCGSPDASAPDSGLWERGKSIEVTL